MHGLGYIARSNAAASARYQAEVVDAAKAEIDRLKAELAEAELKVQEVERNNARLKGLIEELSLIPAPDFYKPGDYAAGLVCQAWVASREF